MATKDRLSLSRMAGGAERPIVFLHGFLGSSQDWEPVAGAFTERDVLMLNLPGHGNSTGLSDGAYSIDRAAALVHDALQAEGIDRCHLCGYSMGGRVAMATAIGFPGMVDSLIIESASPGISDAAARQNRASIDAGRAEHLINEPLESFLGRWYALPIFASMTEQERSARLVRGLSNHALELARAIEGMSPGRQVDYWPVLGSMDCLVTYISGAKDERYVETGRRFAAACSRARHHIVEDAGHNVHFERPEVFISIVKSHISDTEAWQQ